MPAASSPQPANGPSQAWWTTSSFARPSRSNNRHTTTSPAACKDWSAKKSVSVDAGPRSGDCAALLRDNQVGLLRLFSAAITTAAHARDGGSGTITVLACGLEVYRDESSSAELRDHRASLSCPREPDLPDRSDSRIARTGRSDRLDSLAGSVSVGLRGALPSGKATVFNTTIHRFESGPHLRGPVQWEKAASLRASRLLLDSRSCHVKVSTAS